MMQLAVRQQAEIEKLRARNDDLEQSIRDLLALIDTFQEADKWDSLSTPESVVRAASLILPTGERAK